MNDVQLQSALTRLAPRVDETPAWDDVVRRAGTFPTLRWRLVAAAAVMIVATGLVAGALAGGLINGSLDRLSAWVGDQPGEPAPKEQAAFDRENAASYAHFQSGTRVGRLLSFELNGRPHDLLGFRDGPHLCLRVVPPLFGAAVAEPECVPQQLVTRVGGPVAMVGGYVRVGEPTATVVYGLAADSVQSIEVLEGKRLLGSATVANNAFALAVPDEPRAPEERPRIGPTVVLRAYEPDGSVDVPGPVFPPFARNEDVAIPGPDRVERALQGGAVDWLERREPRGEPFAWPYDFPDRILHARVVKPDPTSSFRVAVAYGEDPDWRENGRWLCLVWFWPLIPDSRSSAACTRTDVGAGVMYHGRWPSAGQFPHYVGIAADEVARMEIFYEDGWKQSVPLQDNVFSFYVAGNQSSKLVAYDSAGRVVRIDRLR